MIGATSNEGLALELQAAIPDELKRMLNFNLYISRDLNMRLDDEKRVKYRARLKKNYCGLLQPSQTNIEGIIRMFNDVALWHPSSRIVRSREKSGKGGNTFAYRFDIHFDNNLIKKFMKVDVKYREPTHGDDVCYLFKYKLGPTPEIDSPGFKELFS